MLYLQHSIAFFVEDMALVQQFRRLSLNVSDTIERKVSISAFTEKEDGRLKIIARIKRIIDIATHVKRHKNVLEALSHPCIRSGLDGQPHVSVKYLHPRYLVRGISTDDKAKIVVHHFGLLRRKFDARLIQSLSERGLVIWQLEEDQAVHTILMRHAHPTDNEGEIVLEYLFNGIMIYIGSFVFAPGAIGGLIDRSVLLVTRIQGARDSLDQINGAMKSLHGLGGSTILLAAFCGIARSLGIETILGPSATAQACYTERLHPSFVAMYDEFFARLNARRVTESLYSLALPLREKPLDEIKASNRSKVRAQRNYKKMIMEQVQSVLQDHRDLEDSADKPRRDIAA